MDPTTALDAATAALDEAFSMADVVLRDLEEAAGRVTRERMLHHVRSGMAEIDDELQEIRWALETLREQLTEGAGR